MHGFYEFFVREACSQVVFLCLFVWYMLLCLSNHLSRAHHTYEKISNLADHNHQVEIDGRPKELLRDSSHDHGNFGRNISHIFLYPIILVITWIQFIQRNCSTHIYIYIYMYHRSVHLRTSVSSTMDKYTPIYDSTTELHCNSPTHFSGIQSSGLIGRERGVCDALRRSS